MRMRQPHRCQKALDTRCSDVSGDDATTRFWNTEAQVAQLLCTQRIIIRSECLRSFRFYEGDLLWPNIDGSLQGDKDPALIQIQLPLTSPHQTPDLIRTQSLAYLPITTTKSLNTAMFRFDYYIYHMVSVSEHFRRCSQTPLLPG
jgi:hypothetical protein